TVTVDGQPASPYEGPYGLLERTSFDQLSEFPRIAFWWREAGDTIKRVDLEPSIAAKAGILGGETIKAINGKPMDGYFQAPLAKVSQTIHAHANEPITLTLAGPGGDMRDVVVTPDS